jgi:hypothetical protein
MNLRAWLERLAFSFIILAAALFWSAYRIYTGHAPGTSRRITAFTILGALLLGAGLAGVRLRHRRKD